VVCLGDVRQVKQLDIGDGHKRIRANEGTTSAIHHEEWIDVVLQQAVKLYLSIETKNRHCSCLAAIVVELKPRILRYSFDFVRQLSLQQTTPEFDQATPEDTTF